MKVKYQKQINNVTYEVEFEGDQQEIFEEIANFQEVFEDLTCVAPDGTEYPEVLFKVREIDGNKFYEKVCVSSEKEARGRKLQYGCNKKGGGLFPKRKDEEGNWIGWNGWGKYNPDTKKLE